MEQSSMKILAISDVPSELLWDESVRRRLEGIDLILSCGDLPKKYLEYLTNFTAAPILYVHGNHDGSYKGQNPGAASVWTMQSMSGKACASWGWADAADTIRKTPSSTQRARCGGVPGGSGWRPGGPGS